MIDISRRKLISGLTALIAAPAIIRVASIMPIRAFEQTDAQLLFNAYMSKSIYYVSVKTQEIVQMSFVGGLNDF